ncbi:MAG: hypothetical protein V1777_01770 [Candidatus Micrarchaeota archaeon]
MVKLTRSGPGVSGPTSSLGIMRFFDVDSGGPKFSHQFVFGIIVAFTLLILIIRTLFFK